MTEVMNLFQAIFMFKGFAPINVHKPDSKLAVSLKREAEGFADVATEEMKNGSAARAMSVEGADTKQKRIFAEIAVWHYQRAAEKSAKAADRFEEAERIHVGKIHEFHSNAKEMRQIASEAAKAVHTLEDFLNRN